MNQISLKNEVYRKAFHILLILAPIAYYQLGKWLSLAIFASIATIVVSLDYARRSNPAVKTVFAKIFGIILREHELAGDKLCGASWVALAACINFLLFSPEIAVTAFSILVFSDAAAAIIGRKFPSRPFFEKTFNGAVAFFIVGLIVVVTCGALYHSRVWFYLFGLFALFSVTIIESRPSLLKVDDNFTIPIGFSVIMTTFDLMWNYSY
jgi:dolichol kinase